MEKCDDRDGAVGVVDEGSCGRAVDIDEKSEGRVKAVEKVENLEVCGVKVLGRSGCVKDLDRWC